MRAMLAAMMLLVGGCGTFTEAQMQLTEQARRGVTLCRQAMEEREQLVQRLNTIERERMDEAFDGDVLDQPELSAEWVIEHRKAYSAALAALERRRSSSIEATTMARRNFDATEAALQRLTTLQAAQLRMVGLEDLLGTTKQGQ